MTKTTYTYTCKTCGKSSTVTCYGVFSPMAICLAPWPILLDNIIHHPKTRFSAMKSSIIHLGKTLLVFVLCLFHGTTYIFYPLYLLLNWFFG